MVYLNGTPIKYGYKFIQKQNCVKIGKELSSIKKNWSYKCILRVPNANKKKSHRHNKNR